MELDDKMIGFRRLELDREHCIYTARLPDKLHFNAQAYERLWRLHPRDFHTITVHGRPVRTPRWQQAYGLDYHYTGRVNSALPIPASLLPLLDWSRETVAPELNGVLMNWYDLKRGHYIGRHRDSTKGMVNGSPIATCSFGEERVFRLRPWRGSGYKDFRAENGKVFVIPYATNLAWTHEIPRTAKLDARRISITLRAFIC